MRIFLFILAVLAFLSALFTLLVANSAIHEILAGISFLTSAVLLTGAGVVEAVERLRREVAAASNHN